MSKFDWRAAHQRWSTEIRGRKGPAFVEVLDNIQKPMIVVPAAKDDVKHLLEAIGYPRRQARVQAETLVSSSIDAQARGERVLAVPYNARGEGIVIAPITNQYKYIAEKVIEVEEGYGVASLNQFNAAWIEHIKVVQFETQLQQGIITPDTFGPSL